MWNARQYAVYGKLYGMLYGKLYGMLYIPYAIPYATHRMLYNMLYYMLYVVKLQLEACLFLKLHNHCFMKKNTPDHSRLSHEPYDIK